MSCVAAPQHNTTQRCERIFAASCGTAVCVAAKTTQHGVRRSSAASHGTSTHLLHVGAAVGRLDLRLTGRGFKSQPVRFHVTYVNSALHPSGVPKSSK